MPGLKGPAATDDHQEESLNACLSNAADRGVWEGSENGNFILSWFVSDAASLSNVQLRPLFLSNEDKILLDVANDLDKLPWYKFHYNVIMFNCRHFTAYMRDVGLNKEPPPLILIPLLPPVLPGVKQ